MKYTEKEREIIKDFKHKLEYCDSAWFCKDEAEKILNLLERQRKELENKNRIIKEVEKYARGIKDEELLLILKKDEIEKLVNECKDLLGE